MRRISNLRDVRGASFNCILGPIRILDIDPQAFEWSDAVKCAAPKTYTRGIAQCSRGIMRFTAWGINCKVPGTVSQSAHQLLLNLVGTVVEIKGAKIKLAHKDYQDYGRFCFTFDFSRGAEITQVTSHEIDASIPTEMIDPSAPPPSANSGSVPTPVPVQPVATQVPYQAPHGSQPHLQQQHFLPHSGSAPVQVPAVATQLTNGAQHAPQPFIQQQYFPVQFQQALEQTLQSVLSPFLVPFHAATVPTAHVLTGKREAEGREDPTSKVNAVENSQGMTVNGPSSSPSNVNAVDSSQQGAPVSGTSTEKGLKADQQSPDPDIFC